MTAGARRQAEIAQLLNGHGDNPPMGQAIQLFPRCVSSFAREDKAVWFKSHG